jgi:hypothetical protein
LRALRQRRLHCDKAPAYSAAQGIPGLPRGPSGVAWTDAPKQHFSNARIRVCECGWQQAGRDQGAYRRQKTSTLHMPSSIVRADADYR